MSKLIYVGIWIFGYMLTIFLGLLCFRILGDEPEDLYDMDHDKLWFICMLIIFWPLAFIFELLFYLYLFIRVIYILGIESIMRSLDTLKDNDMEK